MSQKLQQSWADKAERFARTRAQIRQILSKSDRPLNMAQIYNLFLTYFRHLPDLERRMRELVKDGVVIKEGMSIKTYQLSEE